MINCLPSGAIHVNDLHLWAHVGVLEKERIIGQWFSLDFSLWLDLDKAGEDDNLSSTFDYSLAIGDIQQLALQMNCLTIEHFSEKILDLLESLDHVQVQQHQNVQNERFFQLNYFPLVLAILTLRFGPYLS